jgi:SAM-dependent methyltransferase
MTVNYEIDHVKNIYDIIAPEFDITRTYNWPWVNNIMDSFPENSLIYDIGCGNGRNMRYKKHQFIGVDNCDKFVEMCINNNMNAIYSDMTNIQLPSNSADIAMSIASFHHLSNNENRIKALLEMKRIIKDDGQIIISVWSINQPKKTRVTFENYGDNMVYWKNKHARYYYIFKLDEIRTLVHTAGLIIIDSYYDCGNEIFILKKS